MQDQLLSEINNVRDNLTNNIDIYIPWGRK